VEVDSPHVASKDSQTLFSACWECEVADSSLRSGSKLAVICVDSTWSQPSGPGGWGVVLTYGEHIREVHDFELETTDDRLELLAVVRALECLTRPVSAQIHVDSQYVRSGVTDWLPEWQRSAQEKTDKTPDPYGDLWLRLAAATEQHQVEWIWTNEGAGDHGRQRASELARQALDNATKQLPDGKPKDTDVGAEKDAGSSDGPSLDTALTQFLAERQEGSSPRTFTKYKNVIGTLRWSIGYYADKKIKAIKANEITDHLGDFFHTGT
jgi:ribonuclease HI